MLYCPNFFWNVLQVWMTGKDVYLQMTWSWPDKTWNILCSYCLQWNTSQSKFRNHYFLFLFAFSILSQLFLIWGCIYLYLYIIIFDYCLIISVFTGLITSSCHHTTCLGPKSVRNNIEKLQAPLNIVDFAWLNFESQSCELLKGLIKLIKKYIAKQ